MLKKTLLPLTLLVIFMLPTAFSYGNGYGFEGLYYGTIRGIYHYRDSSGEHYRERFSEPIFLYLYIDPEAGEVYIAFIIYEEEVYELIVPISRLRTGRNKMVIKVNYEYSYIEGGRGGYYTSGEFGLNAIIPPIPIPHPIYHYYKYVITIVLRGDELQYCTMRYLMRHYFEDLQTYERGTEILRFVFKGERTGMIPL